ncbi:MAG: tRNA-dihydrouridine synthase [Ignavibacteriales bacterium]|nr:tRNA-dihydrouridine synthase [Ignavibacteriales bacterium]MCF8315028.1 tRNA-dihydrouridine synthase [Ignavibacteriales bacterium]MCF8435976.1 tRNA-dihydrouridine synthase [Ignavibacteriales bacterium]
MLVGKLDLGDKLFVAPMADVSDMPFRQISKELGAGLCFTQMVSAKGVIENDFDSLRDLAFPRKEKPIGVQFLGNDPEILYSASREIRSYQPDLIDLNCGCPTENVVKCNLGANLLENPALIGRLVSSMVRGAGDIPVSVKLRLGPDRKKVNIFDTAKAAEDNGASLLFIHARAKTDKYHMDPLIEWISEVKKRVSIPVVGNGSVFTPQDAELLRNETGCDSVMVARGALGNPFIFQRFNKLKSEGSDPGQPQIDEVLSVALRHISYLAVEYKEALFLNHAKKHSIWYFRRYPGIKNFVNGLLPLRTREEIENFLKQHASEIKNRNYVESDPSDNDEQFRRRVVFWINQT